MDFAICRPARDYFVAPDVLSSIGNTRDRAAPGFTLCIFYAGA
jgi:hypothetical protein